MDRRDFLRQGSAAALGLGTYLTLGACTDETGQARSPTKTGGSASSSARQRSERELAGALDDLRSRLEGTVVLPGEPGFNDATVQANSRYNEELPVAAARCASEADVAICVDWSRKHGIAPVPRNGGHSYAGFSRSNGLVVDVRQLNKVTVDTRRGTAVAGGGALNQDLFDATADGPLYLPAGTCLSVGLGGLTLGGGIGYNTHSGGLTCDHLESSRIVTASGEVLDVGPNTNRDLYWGCRGGAGGNFGINTSYEFSLLQAPDNVGFYDFTWRGADAAAAVLAAFQDILEVAPAAFDAVAMAQATPVRAGGPREAIEVMSRGQYLGPLEELRDLVQPLLKAAPAKTKTLKTKSFWDVQRHFATKESPPHSFGDISRYGREPLPDSVITSYVDLLTDCPSRSEDANGSMWSLGWIGGDVVNSIGRTETAYVHRDMLTLHRPTIVWPNDAPPSVGEDLVAWASSMMDLIIPHTPAESYQNFPNRTLKDPLKLYYAENLDRLVDVKTRYDRDNLFHNPQSIPPRA